jgi:hypothetical protein
MVRPNRDGPLPFGLKPPVIQCGSSRLGQLACQVLGVGIPRGLDEAQILLQLGYALIRQAQPDDQSLDVFAEAIEIELAAVNRNLLGHDYS